MDNRASPHGEPPHAPVDTSRGPRAPLAARARVAQLLAIAFILTSFAANSLLTRWLVRDDHLEAGITGMVRFVAGAATLVAIAFATRRTHAVRPQRAHLWPAFWLGAYAFFISYGYRFIGAAAGTFVFFASVLITMAATDAVLRRRMPSALSIAGAVLALAGLAVLAAGDVASVTLVGLLLMLLTGVSWGAYSLIGRTRSDALVGTIGPFVVLGLVLAVPLVVASSGLRVSPITGTGLAVAALMGAIPTALAYAAWAWTLARISAIQAGVYQMSVPVITALGSFALLGEPINRALLVAGALVVAGMAMTTPRNRPSKGTTS